MRNVFTTKYPAELTMDSCGNMWLYSYTGVITIYSYL